MYIKCLIEKHTKWSKRNKTNQAEDDMYVLMYCLNATCLVSHHHNTFVSASTLGSLVPSEIMVVPYHIPMYVDIPEHIS